MTTLSIIIVTFNAGEVLERTFKSVLSQDFSDYEIIVVDGVSTDNTLSLLQEYRHHISQWISEPDRGLYDAMNKGMALAHGEYVQFLNAGEVFTAPDILSRIFHPGFIPATVIYGSINVVALDGRKWLLPALGFTEQNLLKHGTAVLCHQAMFVRREGAPRYELKYRYKAELNWFFDLAKQSGFSFRQYPEVIVDYYLGGWGHQNWVQNRIDWLRVVVDRYGVTAPFTSGLIVRLWRNSLHRYPEMKTLHRILRAPVRLCRRALRYLESFALYRKLLRMPPRDVIQQDGYAQEGEDLILARLFKGRREGFFVDIGAHHPTRFSNTYKLYKRGWRGINIDPLPGAMEKFRELRPEDINLEQGIVDSAEADRPLTYYMFSEPAFNSFDPRNIADAARQGCSVQSEIQVQCSTIEQVLDTHMNGRRHIDLLTIDVEHFEERILGSFPFDRYGAEVVVVEIKGLDPTNPAHNPVHRILQEKGYSLRSYLFHSAIYLSSGMTPPAQDDAGQSPEGER